MEDGGRLEFASMFDTIHAQRLGDLEDSEQGFSALLEELAMVRRNLLSAWALGVSHGGAMEQREHLLRFTVSCAVRLACMLRVALPVVQPHWEERGNWTSSVFDLFRSLLSFLPWDSFHKGGSSCFGVVVDLVHRFVRFFLPSSFTNVRSSRNFTAVLLILQEASKSLDQTYILPQRTVLQGQDGCPPCPSNVFLFPLLQEGREAEAVTSQTLLLNRPSKRFWRFFYCFLYST